MRESSEEGRSAGGYKGGGLDERGNLGTQRKGEVS